MYSSLNYYVKKNAPFNIKVILGMQILEDLEVKKKMHKYVEELEDSLKLSSGDANEVIHFVSEAVVWVYLKRSEISLRNKTSIAGRGI